MTDTSEVSFKSTSQLLPRPGRASRSICGALTRRNTTPGLMPKLRAASICPRSTPRNAASSTSLE